MTFIDKHIVETYSELFEGLNSISKKELIESLTRSVRNEKAKKEKAFFGSFGAFASGKSAEDIVADI